MCSLRDYDVKYKCACNDSQCVCYKKVKNGHWERFQLAKEENKESPHQYNCSPKDIGELHRYVKCYCKDGACVCFERSRCGSWRRVIKDNNGKHSTSALRKNCCSKPVCSARKKQKGKEVEYKCSCRNGTCLCWRREKSGNWERWQSFAQAKSDPNHELKLSCQNGKCVGWRRAEGGEWVQFQADEPREKKASQRCRVKRDSSTCPSRKRRKMRDCCSKHTEKKKQCKKHCCNDHEKKRKSNGSCRARANSCEDSFLRYVCF